MSNEIAVNMAKMVEAFPNEAVDLSAILLGSLEGIVGDFNIGCETHVDVARIPATVVSIATLSAHLKETKAKLAARPSNVKNVDFEIAKAGLLKQYKMYACALSAMVRWSRRETASEFVGTSKALVNRIIEWGKENPEPTLGSDGKKMWTGTFSGNEARLKSVMCHILALVYADRNELEHRAGPGAGAGAGDGGAEAGGGDAEAGDEESEASDADDKSGSQGSN